MIRGKKRGKKRKKKGKKIEEFENLFPLQFNLNIFCLFCFCVVLSKKKGGWEEREERMDISALLHKNPLLKRVVYSMKEKVKVQITFWITEYIKFIPVW